MELNKKFEEKIKKLANNSQNVNKMLIKLVKQGKAYVMLPSQNNYGDKIIGICKKIGCAFKAYNDAPRGWAIGNYVEVNITEFILAVNSY